MTISVVINRCAKGSLLGDEGIAEYERRTGVKPDPEAIKRDDPVLVAMMRENPEKYAGHCAHIRIVELEDGFKWKIMTKEFDRRQGSKPETVSGAIEWVAADVT